MTTRNLDALFDPEAIALVGASNEAGSVGAVIARNLFSAGFRGPVMPVNPHEAAILSSVNYRSVAKLPNRPDLAVVATPAATVPALIEELGAHGCRAAIIITAGLDEQARMRVLKAARPHLMRIVGPNCLGLMSSGRGLNASFAHLAPISGDIAFITQSGAIATAMLDWANGRALGFSHVISLGDMSDVDIGDPLDYLALDEATKSILIYAEAITSARKFISAGRIAARAKPVIIVKSGRTAEAQRAAMTHTGALAGADAVHDAVFRRAGMLRVDTLRDLFDAAETLASGMNPRNDALMIVTNGGGLGVIAADALTAKGGRLAKLDANAIASLDEVLPRGWSRANPVDIRGDSSGARYRDAIAALAHKRKHGALLVMNCPTGVADNLDIAKAVADAHRQDPNEPMLACWMGEATAAEPRHYLSDAKLPNYETPDEAVRAFLNLIEYGRNQAALLETPAASMERPRAAHDAARDVIRAVLAEGRELLTQPEAARVLACFSIPMVETIVVATPEEAARSASRFEGEVALKILSHEITHKSDIGGVKLGLDAQDVAAAGERMRQDVARARPKAKIDGFTVQPMAAMPGARELIIGVTEDPTFGPVLLVGQGGVTAEIVNDHVMGLPPLNTALARDMVERTQVSRLLAGFRNYAPADLDAVARTLVAVSDLVIALPEVHELDINPLLAEASGVLALDARIVVRVRAKQAAPRFAIRPYPAELAHPIDLDGAGALTLRPVRPEDAGALADMGARLRRNDIQLRLKGWLRALSLETAARLSQIDYDREMVLIAEAADHAVLGAVRVAFDPEIETGEYALIVHPDARRRGLGRTLLTEILDYAKRRGAHVVWGDVGDDNVDMLIMAREMGAVAIDRPAGFTRTEFRLTA
jgi:acetyltransferase